MEHQTLPLNLPQPYLLYLPFMQMMKQPRSRKKSGNKKRTLLEIPYTKRDIEIVYTVFVKKYITTPQIWRLHFTHTKNMKVCQQRLRKLREYGFLRVIEQAHKRGEGQPPYLWALDALGGELLMHERGVDADLINTKPRADEDRSLSIKHIAATTDFQLAILDGCRACGMNLEQWVDEREARSDLTHEKVTLMNPDGQELKPPIPDALFTITHAQKRAIFHLEIDRATEDIGLSTFERQSITAKAIEYLAWEESEHYRQAFGTRPLRVCFATVGYRRMHNMIKAVEKVIQQRLESRTQLSDKARRAEFIRLSTRFRFITFADLHPQTLLSQPVWAIAGSDHAHTLFE